MFPQDPISTYDPSAIYSHITVCNYERCRGLSLCSLGHKNCCNSKCSGLGMCNSNKIHKKKLKKTNNVYTTNTGLRNTNKCKMAIGKSLKMSHLNVRSLTPKIDEIRNMINDQNIDILTVSETWLDESVFDYEIHIDGYCLYRNDLT